jgi:hypothetical protein
MYYLYKIFHKKCWMKYVTTCFTTWWWWWKWCLTLNLLTTTIVAPSSNASKWQMGFNSVFKGLRNRVDSGKSASTPTSISSVFLATQCPNHWHTSDKTRHFTICRLPLIELVIGIWKDRVSVCNEYIRGKTNPQIFPLENVWSNKLFRKTRYKTLEWYYIASGRNWIWTRQTVGKKNDEILILTEASYLCC